MFLTSSIGRFYKWLTFGSIAPLLRRSSKGEVNQDDFLSILDEHEFAEKTGEFVKEIRENKTAGRWHIIRRMMMGCRRYYAVSFFISFIVTVLMLTVPLQLNVLLKQIEETNLSWTLVMFSIAALVCTLVIRGLLFSHGNLLMQRINIIVMRMLTNALLVKIMRIGGKTLDDGESGKIQTLINDDVKNIALYPTILFGLFLTVIQLIALSSMLFWQLGLVALAGILCLVGMLVLQSVLMRYLHTNLQVSRQFRDQRVSVISELFKKFRAIRMSGYTDRFKNHIHEIRESEIKPLFRADVIYMFMQFIMLSTPLLLSIMTFSLYLWQGEKLTIATVFSVIALFSMLRTPMMALSSIVYKASWASIALNRMHDFLRRDESHVDLEDKQLEPGTIKLQKVNLAHQQQCVLSDVTLDINAGELIGIYGATGSGKTALLNLIAGYEGDFHGEIRRAGKISHLQHHVWLANDTLRNNVLFGEAFDEIRYREVLNICQLSQDLDSFPAGDNTLVGELGARLSGGQRQRVALARALYSNSDILMLDNPMSALDPRVAEKIFAQSILPNRGQTRILITNDLTLIAQCDRAFELKDSHLNSLELDSIQQEAPCKIELEQDVQEVVSDDVESYDEEKVETGKIEWPLLKEILRLSGHGGLLLLTIFSLAIVEALRLGSELWLATNVSQDSRTIDDVINIYWGIGALAIGSILLSQLLILTRILNHTRISHKAMLERVIGAPMTFFDCNPQGRIINRFCVDIETCSGELIANSATAITIAFTLLTQVLYISWQMPSFIGVVIVITLIYVQMQRRYRVSARAIRRIQSVIRSPLYSSVSEAIRGAPALRLNKKEAYATKQVMYHFERNMQGLLTASVLTNWLSLRQSLLAAIITGVVAIMAIMSGGGALGALAITYALLASNSIANLIGVLALVEGDMNSARRVAEYCLLEQEISKNKSDKFIVDEATIEFEKVKLRYVKGQADVLSDISFSVKAGEKVGICGRSGAGKSSVFNLLLGLYPHTGGYIHLGGIDVTEINPETRRRLMSTVTQTPLTFSASLRENLDPDNLHSDKNINQVLEETGLIRRVMELLQGLDTNIDVAQLSAGEVQQLVLGRTLLENRPIVLLDEATADMDTSLMTQMAQKLYSAKPKASFILIAHHLLPLMDMDRVIVIEQGGIVEQGSPIELLKNYDSQFYALFKTQASEYKIA